MCGRFQLSLSHPVSSEFSAIACLLTHPSLCCSLSCAVLAFHSLGIPNVNNIKIFLKMSDGCILFNKVLDMYLNLCESPPFHPSHSFPPCLAVPSPLYSHSRARVRAHTHTHTHMHVHQGEFTKCKSINLFNQ